jgi:arylamine N-acetyltransferase
VSDVDLAAYFERVGYNGQALPTLEVLCSLHRLHPEAIPFENLQSRFGVTIPDAAAFATIAHEKLFEVKQ